MQALCLSLCPLSELRDGLNARPHRLEQWSEEVRRSHPCAHLQRTADLLPRSPRRARGSSAAASPSPPLLEWLCPVSAYRRSASASASSSSAASLAAESSLTRPLPVLLSAADHLFSCVWRRCDEGLSFEAKYAFINDRLRQIKKEITMQTGSSSGGSAEATSKADGPSETTSASSAPASSAAVCPSASALSASLSILERSVRFYALSGWLLMGSAEAGFDAQLNRERLQDCLQASIELYSSACRWVVEAASAATAKAASASSVAASSTEALPVSAAPSLASLLDRSDRFRSYSVLLQLQQGPWIELQSMIAEHQRCAANLAAESKTSSSGAAIRSSPPVPRHLQQAAQLCVAHSTGDYCRFFSLYKHLCNPADPEDRFDPVSMALLAPHILPLQIAALRRMSLAYQPNAFFPLSTLRSVLALPSVPDASLLCKSLCSLTVRRPDHWSAMGLAAQETDAAVASEDAAAAESGAASWAVQIKRGAVVEADAMVFGAFYTRELRRRLRRTQAQHSTSADVDPNAAAFGLSESAGVISAVADPAAFASASTAAPRPVPATASATDTASWEDVATESALSSSVDVAPLWIFKPQTVWPRDCLQRWIQGNGH